MSKKIIVKEVTGTGEVPLERGERVIATKIIGEVMALPRTGDKPQYAMPEYKTVIVIERTDYESNAER